MRRFFAYSATVFLTIGFLSAPANADNASQSPTTYTLREIAENNRADGNKFVQCVKAKKYADKITAQANEAYALGAQGTPFTVVFGPRGEKIAVSGAYPSDKWQDLFDILLGKSPTPKPGNETPGALPTATNITGTISPIDRLTETQPVYGDSSEGKIMLVVYTDFDCPFCKTLHDTLQKLSTDEYTKSGSRDFGWVYRHLPLTTIHPTAELKAEAIECAHAQSWMINIIDDLFNYQDNIDVSEFAADYSVPIPTPVDPSFQAALPDTYYARDITNNSEKVIDQELVKIHGNGTDDTRTIIIPSIRKLFPELKKDNLYLDVFATPKVDGGTNYIIFRAVETNPKKIYKEKFYRFDIKKKQLKAMKINKLYQGSRELGITVSPLEDRFFWTPVGKKHSARQLYVFDLLTDTRKLLVSLPASQSFDAGDPKSEESSLEVEWLDNNNIGYTVFSQTKKSKVSIDDPDWHTKLFVREGLFKLKPVRY